MFVTLACATSARSQTRSRDVSDPVTDPGVRVGAPEVGFRIADLIVIAPDA